VRQYVFPVMLAFVEHK